MLHHNLLLIYRNFKRFKSSFFINLIGLSTGMACALLIFLWVSDELSVDKFHENDEQLYQVLEHQLHNGKITTIENTSGLLAESLAEEMPEVISAVAVTPSSWFESFVLSLEEKKIKAKGQFVGKDFFKMFSYNLLQGEATQVLTDKNSVVISEDLALRLFNTTENVVGKRLDWQLLSFSRPVTISGIFAGTPANSSTQFDFALSFDVFKEINPSVVEWGNMSPLTYLLLQKDTDIGRFNEKTEHFLNSKISGNEFRTLYARPYSEGYLYGTYENGKQSGGRIAYVKLFSIIAVFILFIACINFMNLSTAKASRRVKEVGIKKAIGAGRNEMIFQYMGESLMMAFLSLLVAVLLVGILLPQFNIITGKQLSIGLSLPLALSFIGLAIITGIIAGSYPALYLSSFNPASVLKGKFSSSMGELWARKGLVVFQFSLSVILIVSVWVVYKQINYVQNKSLGYDKENIISVPLEGKVAENPEAFLSEIKSIPGVANASTMQSHIVGVESGTTGLHWPGKDPDDVIAFRNFSVGFDMIETLGIEIIKGRSFSRDFVSDSSAIILNEKAVKAMGIDEPVGTIVNLWGQNMQVVGVVKDFHFESMHEEVKPLFIKLGAKSMLTAGIKIEAGKERETLALLESFYNSFNPGYNFDYKFVDAEYNALYKAEQRVSVLSKYFAGLAILISCLGLFGLAAFTAERRLKEIGIRKILGSSDFDIVRLLSSDFTKMVIIAIVIALPVSFFIVTQWLETFAYSIPLEWWYFIGAGFLALVIAWLTVGLQTIKAARVNPVNCLKDE